MRETGVPCMLSENRYADYTRFSWERGRRDLKMMFGQKTKERHDFSGDKVDFTLTPFAQDELYSVDVINFSEPGICLLSSISLQHKGYCLPVHQVDNTPKLDRIEVTQAQKRECSHDR